ncbi:hypothetical protein DPMN_125828 [Dreissena polymorpha]|uniref:Uncharacterized protein n=1 Tax=Dreissena polymorpha TaxID=45954 RepID=A0A9D4JTE8_DREPO|nr:hypothetical protein DPMN_125828 [Dreissena polymorpha]
MTEGFAALHICAANDHVEIASELIQAKADINIRNPEGLTPCTSLCRRATNELCNCLLMREAIKVLSHEDASLLGVSMGNDETGIQISCMLIEAKGSLEVKNKQGKTPLDLCSDFTTREFLKRLV